MKNTKIKVLVVALAVCLLAIGSLSTLAWFTATDAVTNDFYVGDSNTDPDDVFGIDVWEVVDDKEIGKGTADDAGAIYETILPGEKFSKAPYLTNTGVHPQYVRAIVTVSEATLLREAMEGAWGDADKFLAGTNENWTLTDILYTNDDELVYIYYYNKVLAAGATTEALFDAVVIPTGLTLAQAQAMESFSVNVLGQVIQSEHLADPAAPGKMVETAQRAFELYWDAEGTIAGYTDEEILANGKINEDAGAVDVYYTVGDTDTAEISLTGVTATVKEAFVYIPAAHLNSTTIIDGCTLTVEDGGYIAYYEEVGGQQVCMSVDTTINGVNAYELYKTDSAALQEYFYNLEVGTIIWF